MTFSTFAGLLILTFSILAVQGGAAWWNIVALSVLFMVCLGLVFIISRQPQSRTKLSFKVCTPNHSSRFNQVLKLGGGKGISAS